MGTPATATIGAPAHLKGNLGDTWTWVALALSHEDWMADKYILALLDPREGQSSRSVLTPSGAVDLARSRLPCNEDGDRTREVTDDDLLNVPPGVWAVLCVPELPGAEGLAGHRCYPMDWIVELDASHDLLLGYLAHLGYDYRLTPELQKIAAKNRPKIKD